MAVTPGELIAQFRAHFDESGTPKLYRAPGRVNLIGEHTDYNLGFVMPMALDRACFAAAAPGSGSKLRLHSVDLGESFEIEVADLAAATPRKAWTDYIIGVAQQLLALGYPLSPLDLLIRSTVPVGSGLSSSAALEVASALALAGGREVPKVELAKLAHRAENQFVGLPCGIMDQFISVFGHAHCALKIDCRSLELEEAHLPEDLSFLAINSMVKHELGASAYRQRVAECADAVRQIQVKHPEVKSLRDADESMLDGVIGLPLKRARHIIGENQRVTAFAAAARDGIAPKMGELFVASHRSLQHDYEVSCEELDFLVDTAIALPGVVGARMTGGGFGGCTVNIVRPEFAGEFQAKIREIYALRFGVTPQIYECTPSDGADAIFL